MKQKLIYILNHYSSNSEQHFYHVINLINEIANNDVEIALIFEKCDDLPEIDHINIKIFVQQKKLKICRVIELLMTLLRLQKAGYTKVFVRISWVAACVSIIVGLFSKLKTYYWLSGQGTIENYKSLILGIEKIKLLIKNIIPFLFIKTFVYRFVTGPESMGEYMNKVMRVPLSKILILYNDIDILRFTKVTEQEKNNFKIQLGLPADKKLILFVHRLSPLRKTLYYIPYIISEFYNKQPDYNYHFVIAGSGPENNVMRYSIEEAGLNNFITLLGNIPNRVIDKLYKSADIFINPTFAEGFPRVLLEAMACGLPFVTTDAGGIKDIIGERQKEFMVDRNDSAAFADRLKTLIKNKELQVLLKEENLEQVKKFSTSNVAKMYIDKIFDEI